MKHLLGLVLCCLLLSGCGQAASAPTTLPAETGPTQAPVMLYDAGSPMEEQTQGAVRTYPLPMESVYGFRAMGKDLLLFSGEKKTTLTRLSGEAVYAAESKELGFCLDPRDPSVQTSGDSLSYFDPVTRETVVLDRELKEIRRLAAPQDLVGTPILSEDGSTLYYGTATAIRAWDLGSGVRRLVRELPEPGTSLVGLHMEGSILQCTDGEQFLLISAEDGRTLWEGEKPVTLLSNNGRNYASLPLGLRHQLVFGEASLLTPRQLLDGEFLENLHAAVTLSVSASQNVEIEYYDLSTGRLKDVLSLPAGSEPQVEDTAAGMLYILCYDESYGSQVLYRWDPRDLGDDTVYTSAYGSTWLEECRAYAQDLGDRFGIQILIGREAAMMNPWDYDFTPETQEAATWRQLEMLEENLSHYPKSLLSDAVAPFGGLKLCLVRQIQGSPESGSVEDANGIQFRDEEGACLALAVGPHSPRTLHHELFHVLETRLLVESSAFDQWENLNPEGFAYADSYEPQSMVRSWLQGEGRAFIDTYSMSYAKEDRARIMEYAMTPGNRELFQAPILQAKLTALCEGIREAFGLRKSPEAFLWEQYLEVPLAYTE